MLQTSDNIEASTMTYVFDMFGKSVTQMLQASIQQQTAIDELRQQIRACQTQITNICGTLEDFEDRMSVKLAEMRPTIYTRDGMPIDDALEMLQNKIQTSSEKSASQDETISRLEAEIKGKLDIEEFESTSQAANEANDSFTNMSLSIQSMQKELQKQRSEQDSMMEKCAQLVQIQIQRLKTQSVLSSGGFDNSDEYVTKAKFKEVIEKLKKEQIRNANEYESDYFDENDLEGTLNKIKKHSAHVDEEYRQKKAKLDQNLNKVLNMLGENGKEEEEEYEVNDNYSEVTEFDEFEVDTTQVNQYEVRDIGIESKEDNNDSFEIGETRIQAKSDINKRRNVSINCDILQSKDEENDENKKKSRRKKKQQQTSESNDDSNAKSKKEALLEEARKEKERIDNKSLSDSQSNIDEAKITASILSQVMNKIEPILIEFFSSSGVGGVKLDKGEARELITQLSTLNQLKEDMSKLKMLVSIKYDKADAENELSIRITRDEFFSMLMTLFPSNQQIQKAYSNYKKKLPPLKNPSSTQQHAQSQLQSRSQAQTFGISPEMDRSRSRGAGGDEFEDRPSYSIHQRQVKTAAPSALVPARNSKLLALNQKFLKGADGKYYLRDINTSDSASNIQTSNVVGSVSKSSSITADQAFDFQPFLPASTVKEQVGRISVPSQHRARTPPDPND